LRCTPRTRAPGATIARLPSGATATPPPPSARSAIAPVTRPVRVFTRRSRERLPCVELTHASSPAIATPAAPGICRRRTTRPVLRFSTATFPPRCTTTARSDVSATSSGVPASRRRPRRWPVAGSSTSSALRRAAHARAPSGEIASAVGAPPSRVVATAARVCRSNTVTVRPLAINACRPSGVAATARAAPGTRTGSGSLVRVSISGT
jgi:hypothetical protein